MADLGKELQQDEWLRTLPHITELVYCLTRSYLNRVLRLPPTDREVLLFAAGIGLEKVLLRGHRQHINCCQGNPEQCPGCEGIHYDMDFLDYDGRLGEFKSTRISTKRPPEDLPEGWKRQVLGYLYIHGLSYDFAPKNSPEATLAILHLMGNFAPPFPELRAWRMAVTWEEIRENWSFLQGRKAVYLGFLERRELPRQFTYNMEYECNYGPCRYKLYCDARQAADEMEAETEVIGEVGEQH